MSKNAYLIQFYEINICQVMIFRLYTVYNKHERIKISIRTRDISGVPKRGNHFNPWCIKIVMACSRTILMDESQTHCDSPLRYSSPTLNPTCLPIKPEKNRRCYRKCLNNFAAYCICIVLLLRIFSILT